MVALIHIYSLLYPDSITAEQTKDYELRYKKEFVPEAFLKPLSLFQGASNTLLAYIESNLAWTMTINV